MTPPDEVTVIGIDLWADRSEQLARFLATSPVTAIPEPSAVPAQMVNLALPEVWAQKARELTDAQAFASRGPGAPTVAPRTASGTVALIEERLVFSVQEAAQLLGIGRSFAHEAVQRGEIPSMKIEQRIPVPTTARARLLQAAQPEPHSGSPNEGEHNDG